MAALVLAGLVALGGCTNPFAPEEGGIGADLWTPQTTIGGLLDNFRTSYTLRDSLRYADLLADEFVFRYFDPEQGRYVEWYRETELRATGGLFRNVRHLDLRWGPLPEGIDTLSAPDTTVQFSINFSLSAGDLASISGFARFEVRRDGYGQPFRIVSWRDDY